jgi:hypothetical protein
VRLRLNLSHGRETSTIVTLQCGSQLQQQDNENNLTVLSKLLAGILGDAACTTHSSWSYLAESQLHLAKLPKDYGRV